MFGKKWRRQAKETQAPATVAQTQAFNLSCYCCASMIDLVITSKPTRWHTVSCVYTTLFAVGFLSVVYLFRGGRRKISGKGSIRRKQQRTLADVGSGYVSGIRTGHDKQERLVDEHAMNSASVSPRSVSVPRQQVQDTGSSFPPETTEAEVARFVRARKGDLTAGAEQLRHYLVWHKLHQEAAAKLTSDYECKRRPNDESQSHYDWRMACTIAQMLEGDIPAQETTELPCVVFLDDGDAVLRSLDRARICYHLPARIDTRLSSGEVYAQALAIYLDRRLSRDREEKFDVFVDTRPGEGWGNIAAHHLVPFIRHASKLLNDLHPERLHRAVVYPVPTVCAFVWNRLVKPWMDPATADKIVLLGGSARRYAKPPEAINKVVDKNTLAEMERRRIELFDC